MIDLIRERFELWVRHNWIKHINREVDKCNRMTRKTRAQAHIVRKMVERYNEIYPGYKIRVGAKWRS